MAGRFIALLSSGAQQGFASVHGQLTALGLRCCFAKAQIAVYVDADTPTVEIADRGVLMGHLFSNNATSAPTRIAFDPGAGPLRDQLIRAYWGEYVMIEALDDGCARILRDPSGGMRCFYFRRADTMFVTSSLALASEAGLLQRVIEWGLLSHSLVYPYQRSSRTALSGVSELLPGFFLDYACGQAGEHVAWEPWSFIGSHRTQVDFDRSAATVREAIEIATSAWANADRSVLLELSGGLDSSIIAACLGLTRARTICCTLVGKSPGTDERLYARQVAEHMGFPLLAADIDFESARFDFPPPRDAAVPAMGILHQPVDHAISKVAQTLPITSLFSGAGGDSIFCYLGGATPAADAFRIRGIASGLKAVRDLTLMHQCTATLASTLTLRKLIHGARPPQKPDTSFLASALRDVSPDQHPWLVPPVGALAGDIERISDLVGTQSYRDGMLRADHWPMRYPLLSQPVMEACLRVPTWMWIAGGRDRAVARAAFAHALPATILNRRSKGSYGNYYAALYSKNRSAMFNFLINGLLASRGLLDLDALSREALTELNPAQPLDTRLFDLCMVENWCRHQGAS